MSGDGPALGVFTTDMRLVNRTWDPALAELTGIAADRVTGRPLAVAIPDLESRDLRAEIVDEAREWCEHGASFDEGNCARRQVLLGYDRRDGLHVADPTDDLLVVAQCLRITGPIRAHEHRYTARCDK
jgi:PAS domain-containing protein